MRLRVMAVFATAFVGGAIVIFALASLAGTGARVTAIPLQWRAFAVAACLLALALVDVLSLRRKSYCLLGMWRQARQSLIRNHRVTAVAAVWGFDTGLAITTFRVAAVTWGALILTLFGFASWWSGIAYGLAFTVPLLAFLLTDRNGERLERLLNRRSIIQAISAVILAAASALFLTPLLA